ncbi:MAG: HlyD family efflux transporter periplasmic adaptor subunit [Ruminococcus sp.]|nr:HlyD family efflux transporter periplasmic adaptor subunit [Ruminococcus sp.]
MADLYRKASLERMSSPEQLDKTLKITSPLSWLALLGVTIIIIATIIWSVFGTIPETITTNGIIVSPVSTNSVYTEEPGIVTAVYVSAGDELHLGDAIMEIQTNRGNNLKIISDQVGSVSEVLYSVGKNVNQNSEVVRISPAVYGNQVVMCYVPLSDVKKLERGMLVYVYLASADSQAYGHMEARVINIDAKATSSSSMTYILGSDNSLSNTFLAGGAVTAVACELYPSNTTENGYYWSNPKGGNVDVSNGSLCTSKFIIKRIAPISKLFAKIDEIWGG